MDTREQIVSTTEKLIITKGYNGFSYQDIADVIGIKKASIHYHFKTKEDLGVAFVQMYHDRFNTWTASVKDKPNLDRLNGFGKLFKIVSNNGKHICPIGMLTSEYKTLPEKVQQKVHDILATMEDWTTELIEDGIRTNIYKPSIDSRLMAKILINSLSYETKTARIFENDNQLDQIFAELKKLIVA
ncbi:MAG: TetR/AcrR family transcriptional regulator [Proteobacteria bacterium]|nr:TetR/AcrR family transcriptional regulator [Pseudomonadota bacterium]